MSDETTTSVATTTDAGQTNQGQSDAAEGAQQAQQSQQQDAKPARAAPEKYEFKAPEGREFDPEVVQAYSEVARELGMPQDDAQKVLDKMAPVIEARQSRAVEAAVTAWSESAKADKEFGGDKFEENLGVAKSFLTEFGTPEINKLLRDTGLGNHPEVIRLFYRAGKAMGPDKVLTGKASTSTPPSVAQRMYPNMNP